ncbi:MAG TPA: hypothetical protein VH951_04935 [Dehalococcoidia bacterium]|jgi:cobalamin biosynthesis Mg chelatase CobN
MTFWFRRLSGAHPVSDQELSDLVDRKLAPARLPAVESHVAACNACRRAVAELQSLRAILSAIPESEAPRSFALSPERAAARPPTPARRASGPLWAPALALTVLVLLVGVDALSSTSSGSSDTSASHADLSTQKSAAGAATDTFSNAEPVAPAPHTAESAPSSASTPLAGAPAAAAQAAPSPQGDAARNSAAAAQPTASAQQQAPASTSAGGGISTIRVLEVLAALALAASLVFYWKFRPA